MSFDIVRGVVSNPGQTESLILEIQKYMSSKSDSGTLYLGYPLTASADSKITIDALLLTEKCGMVAFIYENTALDVQSLKDEQDALYYHLDFYLKKYGSLRTGRSLAFNPIIITVLSKENINLNEENTDYYFATIDNLVETINKLPHFDFAFYRNLCEALQKVTNIRPQKKRVNATHSGSRGFIIKEIEKEIANLDEWQKKAAYELPNGPQRIRGLAGTGKTIVLALKAAYLHAHHPEWKILITYYTRSMKQQYYDLITKFVNDFSGENPDWNTLKIQHAWGSRSEEGVYYNLAQKLNAPVHTLSSAISKFGRNNPFIGMCEELLTFAQQHELGNTYDAILIDEAQDLPSAFFRLIYKDVKTPKRIIWAYDELQNLSDMEMPSLQEMFGVDENGDVLINIENVDNEPQRDIILPICYRNPPWTLTLAHALGFGIYNNRNNGLPIQTFDNPGLWRDIGYSVVDGRLDHGRKVTIERKNASTPKYFESLLDVNDSILFKNFESKISQYTWVAQEINKNISVDQLDPDDILVIFPEAYTSKSEYTIFQKYLQKFGLNSILAGVNSEQDVFRIVDSITCSGIFRAKGNESPMVYILNSEYCSEGAELVKLRNILFTAITRSRAWVRICVVGESNTLEHEFNQCKKSDFRLSFKNPTKIEMERIRKLNRERTDEDRKKEGKARSYAEELISMLEKGEVDQDILPELDVLMNVLKRKK